MKINIIYSIFIFILLSLPFPLSGEMHVKIWLKIFHKRDKITIENQEGLYLNKDYSKKNKRLKIYKKKNALYCNNKLYQTILIQPVKNEFTAFITKFGKKEYNGEFNITLRDNHFYIINKTSFRTYLQGTLKAELGESFHIETLKAQAVISRSYFLAMKDKFKDLKIDACDIDGHFQVYKGIHNIGPKVVKAARETEGMIIVNPKASFIPYFHSTCGGILLSAGEAWGDDEIKTASLPRKYDGSLKKPNCKDSPYFKWNAKIKKSRIINAISDRLSLSEKIIGLKFNFKKYDILNRVDLIFKESNSIAIKGLEFKAFLEREGIPNIRSVIMQVEEEGKYYHFKGKGFGHLVGMCQWGAEYLAKMGLDHHEILEYYFPGSLIDKK